MENEMIEKIKVSIKNIDEKLNRIYFFVQDTKGNAKASIRYIYEMALTLKDNGHNVIMLYEKKEYTPVTSWLKGSYDELDSYRGISVLKVIAKLFERVLSTQITSHFDQHCLFSDQQHGFRSNNY